jgi:hypothetical protein
MFVKKLACVAAAALATVTAAPASAATFIGDNVTIKRLQGGNSVFKTVTTTVGATPEYSDNFFSIDVTANQVLFDVVSGNFSIGDIVYEISGLDFDDNPATANVIEDFSATQIFASPNKLIGMDRATITPTGLFRFSLKQTTGASSGFATVTFGAAPIQSAVPEPATWAMMIGGFGLVGGAMRSARRRRSAGLAVA